MRPVVLAHDDLPDPFVRKLDVAQGKSECLVERCLCGSEVEAEGHGLQRVRNLDAVDLLMRSSHMAKLLQQ